MHDNLQARTAGEKERHLWPHVQRVTEGKTAYEQLSWKVKRDD